MQERPFHENHDEMFRWYDYWLKGIDTGIMDEPPISVFVEGASSHGAPKRNGRWRGRDGRNTYLRPRHRLDTTPEPLERRACPARRLLPGAVYGDLGGPSVKWTSAPLLRDTEMTGPGALYVHAAIDTDDTNLIAKLYDVDPQGHRQADHVRLPEGLASRAR